MSSPNSIAVRQARSLLFVPADRPERYAKALASGADMVIIDLEDAVGSDGKTAARAQLEAGMAALPFRERHRLMVRINGEGTAWLDEDLALVGRLAGSGLGALMVPKVEGIALLQKVVAAVPGLPLVPQIESGAGLDALDVVARGERVERLCLGHLDLQNDLGIRCGQDESEIAPARWDIVRASRRADLPPAIDSVTADIRGSEAIEHDAARALRQGFGGKLCIHPAQVASVNAAYTPTDAQQDWARKVLAAVASSQGAACSVDGRMVDLPVIRAAQRLLAHSIAKPG